MPANSIAQQKLFGMALSVKRGETKLSDIDAENRDEVKKLSEMPE